MGKLIIGDFMKRKKKKRRFYHNKFFILFTIILLSLISYLELHNHLSISKYLNEILFAPSSLIASPKFTLGIEESLKAENEQLKGLLKVSSNSNFNMIYATVVERNYSYWLDSVVINKGKNDGIESGMIVVDSNGMVGLIDKVSFYTSSVQLLTSPKKNNYYSVEIRGEEKVNKILSSSNLVIEGINKNAKIKKGDLVFTNGLEGKYPSGILIGEIEEIVSDNLGVSNKAVVKMASSMDDLRFVAVLKVKK